LECERNNWVVNDHDIFQFAVFNYAQIFDKHPWGGLDTVVAV
jgi:hypothetical protein